MPFTMTRSLQGPVDEPGYFLGGVLLAALIGPIVYGAVLHSSHQAPPTPVLVGLYAFVLGSVFLCSYFFSHKSFLFRWFAWFCEHFSAPASRKMAFFYAGLLYIMGAMSILHG